MAQTITQVAAISLMSIAAVFYMVGFICFKAACLNERNSTSTYGTLVGFRRYYTTDQWGDNGEDYAENKVGRVPVVAFKVENETVEIAAVKGYYSLTKADIGKQIKIRYRRFIGITMIIDDAQSVQNYNQLQNILFWTFMCVATIVFMLGFLAVIFLPKMLDSILF